MCRWTLRGIFNLYRMEILRCRECGSVDYIIKDQPPHKTAYCTNCGSYIKNIKQEDLTIWFGKYKGMKVSEMNSPDQKSWLLWAFKNASSMLRPHHLEIIMKHLGI